MDVRHHRVPEGEGQGRGDRLDAHLAQAFPDLSRSRLRQLIDDGQVRVDGKVAKAAQRLKGGEAISLEVPPPAPAVPQPEALPVTILYEDPDLLVLDKAAGVVVHPGAGHATGTLVNALLHHVKDLRGVGGELRPGIVHRLDRETSGCLVVAKHERSLRALQASFHAREVHKLYLALVHGTPKPRGRFDTLHGRHPVHRQRFTTKVTQGKPAITEYRVVEQLAHAALVEADLLTGRTHQIRVHFSEAGHPLLADALYGRARKLSPEVEEAIAAVGRHALHAWKLSLPHPSTGKRLEVEAPVPEDFQRALEALRKARRT